MATSEKPPRDTQPKVHGTIAENQKYHKPQLPENIASSPTKRQCKTSRRDSDNWNYFKHNEDKMNPRTSCIYCEKSCAADRSCHGTKSLLNHLMYLCPNCREEDPKQNKLSLEPQHGQEVQISKL